ncbi:MAG: tetratricopeptide repeat protein, partial [Kofleriaceae bacterium]|nr:tetratricopeptide repeat protein [Kofleriaceae bacterium]
MTKWAAATGLALIAVSLAIPTAWAKPRYSRDASLLPLPPEQRSPKLAPSNSKPIDTSPSLPTFDQHLAVEKKKRHIAKAIVNKYIELIAATDPTSPDMPDYLFRLAEAHAQNQRHWRFRAMNLHTEIDGTKGDRRTTLVRKQRKYFRVASNAKKAAISIYTKLAQNRRYRGYGRMDEVLFYLGYTLHQAKRHAESLKIYHQLTTDFPSSKYVPQAYLSFGDHFFETGDLDNAADFYDKVLQYPNSTIYPFAIYKRAWVSLNRNQAKEALASFLKVATLTQGDRESHALNKAAKRDFVRAYAIVGRVDRALNSFRRVDKVYAFTMLELLGSTYLAQGKGKHATQVYRELITLKRKSPSVCEWQGNILSAVLGAGNKEQKYREIVNLASVYRAHKKAGILSGAALEECRDMAQDAASAMALTWHREAMLMKSKKGLRLAQNLYSIYLDTFTSASDVGTMQYHYADLLWYLAENESNGTKASLLWEKSAIAFSAAVRGGKLTGKALREAAYAPVLAWKNALDIRPRTKLASVSGARILATGKGKTPSPRPIDRRSKKMLEAFDVYTKYVSPGDPEIVLMRFYKARILWRFDHLEKALPLFMSIVRDHSSHDLAGTSAWITADSLNRLGHHSRLSAFASKTLANKSFMKDKDSLRERLVHVRIVGLRLEAERLETRKKYVPCGLKYMSIFSEYPTEEGMDEVLYNAGRCFQLGKSIGLAIQSFSRLERSFPNSPRTPKSLILMANAYGSIAAFEQAAQKYEEYATRFPDEKDAPSALNNAVTYRKGIGHAKKAAADIDSYVRRYRKRQVKAAAAALFGLAGIYESSGERTMAAKVYKRYLREFGSTGGIDRELIATARIGEILWKQSCPKAAVNGACVRITRDRATRQKRYKRRSLSLPTQCGDSSKNRVTLLVRDPRLSKQAQHYFSLVARLARSPEVKKLSLAKRDTVAFWSSSSRFYANEKAYEKFLSLRFPQGLNFSPNKPKALAHSQARLRTWISEKSALLTQVKAEYLQIKDVRIGGPTWAVAAAARVGQLYQNYSGEFFTAPIPREVRTGAFAE